MHPPLLIVRDESHRLSLGELLFSVGLLKQSKQARNLGENKPSGVAVRRPSNALVLKRARFFSVVPGCVVKTVVTAGRRKMASRSRLGECQFPRLGPFALGNFH